MFLFAAIKILFYIGTEATTVYLNDQSLEVQH